MPGGLNAPPEPFVPEPYRPRPGFALLLVGFGGAEQHAEVIDQVRRELPPLFDFVTPMPYVALRQMFDGPGSSLLRSGEVGAAHRAEGPV